MTETPEKKPKRRAPAAPKPRAPRKPKATPPVAIARPFRPITSFHWGYPFSVKGEGPRAERLRAFFEGFVKLSPPFEGHGFLVIARDDHEAAAEAFERNIPVLYFDDVEAAARFDASEDARRAWLDEVLEQAGGERRGALEMMLSAWPEAQHPEAAEAHAKARFAAWPSCWHHASRRLDRAYEAGNRDAYRGWVSTCQWNNPDELEKFDLAGRVTTASFETPAQAVAAVASLPMLRELSIRGMPTVEQWAALARLEHVEHLSVTDFTQGNLEGLSTAVWWGAGLGARLKSFTTYGIKISADELAPLTRGAATLEHLKLDNARLAGAAVGARLAEVLTHHPVRSLEAEYNELGPEGAERLFKGRAFPTLEALCLSANEIGDAGALALAENPRLPKLRWLTIRSNDAAGRLTRVSAEAFARGALPSLRTLMLMGQGLGSAGCAALLGSAHLSALRTLNLSYCDADWAEVIALLDGRGLASLERLDLGAWSLKTKPSWADARFLRGVKALRVDGIAGNHLAGLLASGHLDACESLVLGGVYASHPKAIAALKSAAPLPALRHLSIRGWKLNAESARALVEAPFVASLEGIDAMSGGYVNRAAATVFHEKGLRLLNSAVFAEYVANDVRTYPLRQQWLNPDE